MAVQLSGDRINATPGTALVNRLAIRKLSAPHVFYQPRATVSVRWLVLMSSTEVQFVLFPDKSIMRRLIDAAPEWAWKTVFEKF
ncbi:hypothetical protein VTL71DRAFT_7976 [Oculimacula yallundae]|uniref:Uncharacterized protein n=1 Tax=Oculimacula yallundae TaxID=86028 RepID=A0ABR4CXU2_9HELO